MPKTKKIVKKRVVKAPGKKAVVKKSSPKTTKRTQTRKVSKSNKQSSNSKIILAIIMAIVIALLIGYIYNQHHKKTTIDDFKAKPFNVVQPLASPNVSPKSLLSPTAVKTSYNIPTTNSGTGTIVIVNSFDDPTAAADLDTFSSQFGLPACTTANGCFTKYKMVPNIPTNSTWAIEDSLDLQWAHAIAPGAKILLVEAKSDSGTDLISALNYVKTLPNIRSVSLSWGGNEFNSEVGYENSFINSSGATYFVASGDSGHGTSWPSVSANVISVGGTTLTLNPNGSFKSETAWNGSGGGVSSFIAEPARQIAARISYANGHRGTPDVSFNANPNSGYPVYDSTPYGGYRGWFQVGGTSAGTPQWAALNTLSSGTITANKVYTDATTIRQTFLRDITSGNNGYCGTLCTAATGYDYVTGWGSPITTSF